MEGESPSVTSVPDTIITEYLESLISEAHLHADTGTALLLPFTPSAPSTPFIPPDEDS